MGCFRWGAWGDPIFGMLSSHYIPELYPLVGVGCSYSVMGVETCGVFLGQTSGFLAPNMLLCSDSCAVGSQHQSGPHSQALYSRNMDKACRAVSNSCWLVKHTKETKLPLACFLTHLFALLVVYPNPKRQIKDFVQLRRPSLNLFGNFHVLRNEPSCQKI